ncbi:MAG TPA: hypothetical protein VEB19_12125, partial [Gemmatimonadaceae bacterium]|nr:hypothetical protein [Gemmatimonadaceae bacterium]
SVWTSMTPTSRQLMAAGRFVDGRYQIVATPNAPFPSRPAEARHDIVLTRLSDDVFHWYTEVPYAIGSISAASIGAFFAGMFGAAEGRSESEVRADYRAVLPRTSAVAGQLFRIDSIRTTQLADRSTSVVYAVTMTPAGIEQRYPQYAKYLKRYVLPAKMKWTLTDTLGGTFFDMSIARGQMVVRVRTAARKLVTLSGPARLMPDSLTLNGDVAVKIGRFTVGFRDYHGDFQIIRTPHERAWNIVSRQEPQWVLPLITERLLRAPLRRPFSGKGAQFRIGVRDSAGAQTILNRRVELEVQESAILRFLARLGAVAISDYAGDAEKEEMAWLRELFSALVTDLNS